nr:MAG TPA: hypothetical protein [Bacteriophage sp.]
MPVNIGFISKGMTMELSKVKIEDIFANLLRIIKGGIKNNKAMVMQYGERLAKKFDKSGDVLLANCIRDQLYGGVPAVMDKVAKSTGDTNIDNDNSVSYGNNWLELLGGVTTVMDKTVKSTWDTNIDTTNGVPYGNKWFE